MWEGATKLWIPDCLGIIWGLSWKLAVMLSPYLIYTSSINCGPEITQNYGSLCSNSHGYLFILYFSSWVIVWQPDLYFRHLPSPVSSFITFYFSSWRIKLYFIFHHEVSNYILFFIMKYQTIIQSPYLKPSKQCPVAGEECSNCLVRHVRPSKIWILLKFWPHSLSQVIVNPTSLQPSCHVKLQLSEHKNVLS